MHSKSKFPFWLFINKEEKKRNFQACLAFKRNKNQLPRVGCSSTFIWVVFFEFASYYALQKEK